MQTTDTGNRAEKQVARRLQAQGFRVLDLNWRTPACEIDIIAHKAGCVYFVEVRYRADNSQGGGLASITQKKQHHMQRAAEIWTRQVRWNGEYMLMAASLNASGKLELVELY